MIKTLKDGALRDYSRDTVFDGRIKLFQPKSGFRANVDSLLLAACVEACVGDHGLDVGSGCGGTALPLLGRLAGIRLTCIDTDSISIYSGRIGAHANGFEDRLYFLNRAIENFSTPNEARFDFALTNPPYFAPGSICPPGVGKEGAYLSHTRLDDWVRKCLHTLRHKGTFYMIHRAADLANCLSALDGRAGQIVIRPIASFRDGPAKRVIIKARKGLRRGEVRLLAPIHLHNKGHETRPSDMLLSVRRGGALPWE